MAGTMKVFFGSLESVRSPIFTAAVSHPVLTAMTSLRRNSKHQIGLFALYLSLIYQNLWHTCVILLFRHSVGLILTSNSVIKVGFCPYSFIHSGTPFEFGCFSFNNPSCFDLKESLSLSSLGPRHALPTYSHLDIYGYSPSIHPASCGLPAAVCETEASAHARSAQHANNPKLAEIGRTTLEMGSFYNI